PAVAPVGATPRALIPMTLLVFGLKISACVSPPHESVSHIVHPAASIAAAASTALPPLPKISAPAVAESGLPVMASQCSACKGGFCVRRGIRDADGARTESLCCAPAVDVAARSITTVRMSIDVAPWVDVER